MPRSFKSNGGGGVDPGTVRVSNVATGIYRGRLVFLVLSRVPLQAAGSGRLRDVASTDTAAFVLDSHLRCIAGKNIFRLHNRTKNILIIFVDWYMEVRG